MTKGNRPTEIFGYPITNHSGEAVSVRERHWCPFRNSLCIKRSRLINYPFGICSVQYRGQICTTCPCRFEEQGTIEGIPRVLEDVALHYFGDFNNVIAFSEVKLPNIGNIDHLLVRHKPLKAEVDDFVAVEFQTDSTTGTGSLVRSLIDFFDGQNLQAQHYKFGMNTYDTIKRSMTQLLNKGIVYEAWNVKCYWIIQEYIYTNLANRYGLKNEGFVPEDASRFALYNLVGTDDDRLTLTLTRYVSTTVDEVYQAMRRNPGHPDKDKFIQMLNVRLRAKLGIQFL